MKTIVQNIPLLISAIARKCVDLNSIQEQIAKYNLTNEELSILKSVLFCRVKG